MKNMNIKHFPCWLCVFHILSHSVTVSPSVKLPLRLPIMTSKIRNIKRQKTPHSTFRLCAHMHSFFEIQILCPLP